MVAGFWTALGTPLGTGFVLGLGGGFGTKAKCLSGIGVKFGGARSIVRPRFGVGEDATSVSGSFEAKSSGLRSSKGLGLTGVEVVSFKDLNKATHGGYRILRRLLKVEKGGALKYLTSDAEVMKESEVKIVVRSS